MIYSVGDVVKYKGALARYNEFNTGRATYFGQMLDQPLVIKEVCQLSTKKCPCVYFFEPPVHGWGLFNDEVEPYGDDKTFEDCM
jgi:hypothetical protein